MTTPLWPIVQWISAAWPAQVDYATRIQGLQGAFRRSGNEPTDFRNLYFFLAIVAVLLVLLVIARNVQQRSGGEPNLRKPYALFAHLLRKLGVGPADRLLLRYAARKCRLRQPTVMLLHPDLLWNSVGRWADSLSFAPFRDYARQRLAAVAARAFE